MVLTAGNSPAGERFVARGWTTADGLPSNEIRALAQSWDGYLWIGTPRGLCRYDGHRFLLSGEEEGMGPADIQRMVADQEGRIWVEDGDGKVRVRRNKIFEAAPAGMAVGQTAADGSIWGLGRSVFTRCLRGKTELLALPPGWDGTEVIKFLPTAKFGLLAMSWKGGMAAWTADGVWKDWAQSPGDGDGSEAGALMEDASGAVWLCAKADQVWKISLEEGRSSWALPGNKNGFWEMIEREPGEIWATATDGRVWRLEDGEFRLFPLAAEIIATKMLRDRSGALWLATAGSGLLRIDKAKVASGRLDALPGGGRVSAMAELEPGVFAVGTSRDGVWRWSGESDSARWPEDDPDFQSHIYCNAMLKARDGTLWVGTNFALHRFRGGRRLPAQSLAPMVTAGDSVMSLHECRDGSLLAGLATGRLHRVWTGGFERIPVPGCGSAICDLAEGPDGEVWAVSKWDGIFRIGKDGAVTRFGQAEGLKSRRSYSLFIDRQNRLWAGQGTDGLLGFRGGRFVPVPLRGEGASNSVLQMLEDDQGWLWFGGDQGLSGISLDSAEAALAGGPPVLTVHAGKSEGMDSEQCQAMKPLMTADGRILFGTMKGFVHFQPEDVKDYPDPPPPVLEKIVINESSLPLSGDGQVVEISPDARFEIHYTGIDLRYADRLRFRHRLKGLENQWNEVGERRFASYNRVPPGDYEFELSCRNASDWSPVSLRLALRVRPHFWQEIWFQSVLGLAVLGGVALASRAGERARARRRAVALAMVNEERARIALDLHDGIGAGLTQVSLMAASLPEDAGPVEEGVIPPAGLSRLLQQRIRALAQDLDIAVWATSPRHDHVASLCTYLPEYMIEYFRNSGIRCWISIPENPLSTPISPEIRHHLFMGVREVMNNCLKHSGATEIRLEITSDAQCLHIQLADNGHGFSPELAERGGRNGLKNLRERMAAAGGVAAVESGPAGTVVLFSVDLAAVRRGERAG